VPPVVDGETEAIRFGRMGSGTLEAVNWLRSLLRLLSAQALPTVEHFSDSIQRLGLNDKRIGGVSFGKSRHVVQLERNSFLLLASL
jgi:hypothetical protein